MYKQIDFLTKEITKRYGTIQRARGYFLYTRKGVRLVDLYQEAGRAIVGWKTSSSTVFKNIMNRGLTGSFDTDYVKRIPKAINTILESNREIYTVNNIASAFELAKVFSNNEAHIWKAWDKDINNIKNIDCVIVIPPFPWIQDLFFVAINKNILQEKTNWQNKLDRFENNFVKLSGAMGAGIARSFYDLIAELKVREEKHWFLYDTVLTKYWLRKGAYLYPKVSKENYESFLLHCIECEVIISPEYDVPSIVPFGVDKGVFTKLKKSPFEII